MTNIGASGIQTQIDALKAQEPTKYQTAYQGYREYQMTSPGWLQWNDKVNALKQRLDGINDVHTTLAGQSSPPLFLIACRTSATAARSSRPAIRTPRRTSRPTSQA